VKPTRLRWLEPGRVRVRSRPKAKKGSKASKTLKENSLEEIVTKAATGSISSDARLLQVELLTEPGALIQATEYCKF
jgi:hypothetical protein